MSARETGTLCVSAGNYKFFEMGPGIAIQGLFHREHRAKCDQSRNDSSRGTNSKVFEGGEEYARAPRQLLTRFHQVK